MCNLYSITKGQRAIIEFTRAMRDTTGNLPSQPGLFPDYLAPNRLRRRRRETFTTKVYMDLRVYLRNL
jgi:hypothetical protein